MIRLSVPYAEKDIVKQYGARWNSEGRFWYFPGSELPAELTPWVLRERGAVTETALKSAEADNRPENEAFQNYWSVSQLNERIRKQYYETPELREIYLKGEISGLKEGLPQGGEAHLYFSLKDAEAVIDAVFWRGDIKAGLKQPIKNGQLVAVKGSLDYYPAQGKTQVRIEWIRDIGDGQASLALLKLRESLEKEGLFRPELKKEIPRHPAAIGIVTSRNGQAIQDICQVAKKRNPYVQLVLFHVAVQGSQAVSSIVTGIRVLDEYGVDTIIVGRGGGSEEELGIYNDEAIVRAVAQARTPVISAVGHAGNWTLIDLAADKRVATPTEAASEAVPDVLAEINRIKGLLRETRALLNNQLLDKKRRLEREKARLAGYHPAKVLAEKKSRLEYLRDRLKQGMDRQLEQRKHGLAVQTERLHGLSPTAKLVNGFGYISREGRPLTSVEQASAGDELMIRIHDGKITARVVEISRRWPDE